MTEPGFRRGRLGLRRTLTAATTLGAAAAVCLVLFASPGALAGDADSPTGRAEPRHVVLLVDRDPEAPEHAQEGAAASQDAMPLTHLGAIVHLHDVRSGPPADIPPGGLRGVVTHLEYGRPPAPAWLLPWLRAAVAGGARLVLLENPGCLARGSEAEPGPGGLIEILAAKGVEMGRRGPVVVEVESRVARPELLHAEYTAPQTPAHWDFRSVDARNSVVIETWREGAPNDVHHPVILGDFGGIALHPWFANLGSAAPQRRWRIDAFEFFAQALDLERLPAPDPCVLNGNRVFFCHIDGDGFVSRVPYADSRLCGEVFADRIVDAFDLPFTISVVVGELTDDLDIVESTPAMRAAADLLARPNVEAASHGVLHPFYWHAPPRGFRDGRVPAAIESVQGYDFSWPNEVRESVRFIDERLISAGKRCELMLWTGTGLPDEETLRTVRELGLANLNAGEFRWDALFDSVANVSALGRRVGPEVQAFAAGPNERMFEGYFGASPGAYKHAAVTIERTGADRILKPANVYAHIYGVERIARLNALLGLIQRFGVEEDSAPVFASVYAKAVASALTTASVARIEGGWVLRDFGACRTARIDDEERTPDLAASSGVLGYRRRGRALYVHLAAPDARLVLSDHPTPQPYVHSANHLLEAARRDADGVSFESMSYAPRYIEFAGFEPAGEVTLRVDGRASRRKVDSEGHVLVALPPGGPDRVEVRR